MSVISSISPTTTTSTAVESQAQPKIQLPKLPQAGLAERVTQEMEAAVDHERMQEMVDRANRKLAGAGNQRLSFGYEERLNRLYVQIKDNATGEVVREIPPRKLIEQQAAMSEMIGIILDRNA